MTDLIEASDVRAYLNTDVPEQQVALLTGLASDVIRNHCGWRIDRGVDTFTVGWNDPAVMLPTLKLNAITLLSVAGVEVDPASYTFSENGVIRWAGPYAPGGGGGAAQVTAVVDHGYDPVPREIQACAFAAVARVVVNPQGMRSVNVGAYSEVYTIPISGEASGLTLLGAERRILDRYRLFA